MTLRRVKSIIKVNTPIKYFLQGSCLLYPKELQAYPEQITTNKHANCNPSWVTAKVDFSTSHLKN